MTPPQGSTHQHEWVWMHDWWGAHVCECGEVQESPPSHTLDPRVKQAEAALAEARAALRVLTYLPEDELDNFIGRLLRADKRSVNSVLARHPQEAPDGK